MLYTRILKGVYYCSDQLTQGKAYDNHAILVAMIIYLIDF